MQHHRDIELRFKAIQKDSKHLLQESIDEQQRTFLKEWLTFSQNQTALKEQKYIWELVHGWPLDHFSSGQQGQQVDIKFVPETIERINQIKEPENVPQGEAVLHYLSNNQAILQQGLTIFWINPTDPKEEVSWLKEEEYTIIVVLSVSDASHMLSTLRFLAARKSIKLVTLELVYTRLKLILNYLQGSEEKYQQFMMNRTYMLRPEEYYDYGGFFWYPRPCCWLEPTFDLIITPNKAKKKNFIIQASKVTEIKYIYYGWKKGFISQTNYQKYTSATNENCVSISSGSRHPITQIVVPDPRAYRFLEFIQKELIKDLQNEQRAELWACSQPLQYTRGQVIVKSGTLYDYIFLLFEGTYEQTKGQETKIIEKMTEKRQVYGLQQLRNGDKSNQYYLRAVTDCSVLRIEKQNFKFLLYDFI